MRIFVACIIDSQDFLAIIMAMYHLSEMRLGITNKIKLTKYKDSGCKLMQDIFDEFIEKYFENVIIETIINNKFRNLDENNIQKFLDTIMDNNTNIADMYDYRWLKDFM